MNEGDDGALDREDFPLSMKERPQGGTDEYARCLIVGMLDVLIVLGVELDKRGLISRAEIATLMHNVILQQQATDHSAGVGDRGVPAGILRAFFRAPVFDGNFN